jgi:hypothetical protein
VQAKVVNGEWIAMLPEYGRGRGRGIDGSDWVRIPDHKIIRERNPTAAHVDKDGNVLHEGSGEEGHLCWTPLGGVLCFVPPSTGG